MGREWVAVNVRDVIVDVAVGPGIFELSDLAVGGGRQLDGDANVGESVCLAEASRWQFLHGSTKTLSDRSKVDRRSTVVNNSGRSDS